MRKTSYDSYPAYDAPIYQPAFLYDLMRSLKHQPFMLMESTPSQVNWQPYSPLKRPGQMAAQLRMVRIPFNFPVEAGTRRIRKVSWCRD